MVIVKTLLYFYDYYYTIIPKYKSKILLCTTAAMEYHCSHCQVYIIYLLHFECASLGQFAGDHGNAAAVSVRGGGAVGLHWGTGRRGWAV